MSKNTPYREIERGFALSAERYDREIGTDPAMVYMRRVSLAALTSVFQPGQQVLEIGCGTGEEAIALGQRGIHVLATDLSPQMLTIVKQKVATTGLQRLVQTRQLAAGEIGALVSEFGRETFDGAYASFGPLNGEADLRVVAEILGVLLHPGSHVIASVMNRFCAFETLWYLTHGRPRQAVRRWSGKTLSSVSPTLLVRVPTWYYTPRAFLQAFPAFRRVRCCALPLLLPPPFASGLWLRFPHLIARLRYWEDRLACSLPALGDHFLITLEHM